MINKNKLGALDVFRIIAAILIIAVHTSPLLQVSSQLDFILTRVIARIAVPFFFMCTGYFVLASRDDSKKQITKSIKKLGILYGISILIYLPINIYANQIQGFGLFDMLKTLVFDGTFYHLWYFPASIIGIVIVNSLLRKLSLSTSLSITFVLYLVGLFGDSYYELSQSLPVLSDIMKFLFLFFDYTRNGIFMAPLFMMLGVFLNKIEVKISKSVSLFGFGLMMICMIIESLIVHDAGLVKHDSMYLFLIPCMIFLFNYLLQFNIQGRKSLRDISLIVYIIHPLVLIIIRGFAKVTYLTDYLVDNYFMLFFSTTILSFLIAIFLNLIKKNSMEKDLESRAWIEISKSALENNLQVFKNKVPKSCKILGILKADAYGHGLVVIGKLLNENHIYDFGVATLKEGIELRKNHIKGEILILGYTELIYMDLVKKYNLTQTVVSYDYAKQMNESTRNVKAHLALDTGMHRLGIDADNLQQICEVLSFKNIHFTGVFSHLCVADEVDEESKMYTNKQIQKFQACKDKINRSDLTFHILASYGALRYSDNPFDMIRLGIGMYGVYSSKGDIDEKDHLKPVLSIKAKVVLIRNLKQHEKVGYGLQFVASHEMTIAVVSIGYGDGIPRELSCGKGGVLIRGNYAPIIGRMCMDQFMVDVSHIKDAAMNDIATLVGMDNTAEIRIEDMALQSNTITNEILSQLKKRLPRIIVD